MRLFRADSERGSILIQVGVAILALTAFMMFVVDYGIMWVSRNQAQNSADAGALAGAVAMAFDENGDDLSAGGPAQTAAREFALRNDVWGGDVDVEFDTDIRFSTVDPDPNIFPAECLAEGANCIRVDVYRNQARENPLPMWFGPLVGRTEQGVRATAIAWPTSGNAVDCLRPFAIPDYFNDVDNDGWGPGDTYSPMGYKTPDNLGDELFLRQTDEERVQPGWFRLLDLLGGGGGGTSDLRDVIRSCAADAHSVGDDLIVDNGVKNGIKSAVDDLIALDPDAEVDADGNVTNSCVTDGDCQKYVWDPATQRSSGPVADPDRTYSPRIIPLAIFDPMLLATEGRVQVVNVVGFFILDDPQQWTGKDKFLKGVIVDMPGLYDGDGGNVDNDAAFLKVIQLVR